MDWEIFISWKGHYGMTADDFGCNLIRQFLSPSPHTFLWKRHCWQKVEDSWPSFCSEFSEVQKKEMEIIEGIQSRSTPSRLPIFRLYTRLLFPDVQTRAAASLQHVLTAPKCEGGLEQGEQSVGFVCLLEMSNVHKVCQETCAMSLTRVWMSCRHRGHVSNCKAHSIHIPLKKNEEKRN